jgi:hypothetical protein
VPIVRSIGRFLAAALIYTAFAVYLYQPHFSGFQTLHLRDIFVVNVSLASLGCFLLSRRWVASFWGSLFAGAIYGFGPFTIGLSAYHPAVNLLTAAVPWLFCPAAFCHKTNFRWAAWPLSAVPFIAIILFFQTADHFRLFALPLQARLYISDLRGLLAPLVMINTAPVFISFYHIPIAPLIIGVAMLIAAQRFSIVLIFLLGTALAFSKPFLDVSPLIWLTVPVLCCSVFIGAGMQGLAAAGTADKIWLLLTATAMALLCVVALLLSTGYSVISGETKIDYTMLFLQTAQMYIAGACLVAFFYFTAYSKLHITALRWLILSAAMAADIFLSARFVFDKVF